MIRYITIFLILPFTACSEGESIEFDEEELSPAFFENFPEQPFLDISWAESNEEVGIKLMNQGYTLQPGSEDHFYNSEKKIEFIIAEFSTHLVGFKIFLKDENDLKLNSDYTKFFLQYATESEVSNSFSTYTIIYSKNEYKITQYSQEDFIRFEFTLQDSH